MTEISGNEKRKAASLNRGVVVWAWLRGIGLLFVIAPFCTMAQSHASDSLLAEVTLPSAIAYAIKHQPKVEQALIDEQITASNIRSKLADWYPQVNFNYSLQHNFLVPTSFFGGNPIKAGVNNTSAGQFTASQIIFNRDVLLAKRTRGNVELQTKQATSNAKIDIAVNVAKAFYDVLTTSQQIKVATENITRTERSLKDARAQYDAGLVDKIDYKRATITLNNIKASKRSNEELVKAKTEYLKALMSYPDSATLNIVYDSLTMENGTVLDTLQRPDYTSRIEYRLLETQHQLLEANVLYSRWSYLPNVSANAAYNLNFQNNNFGKLYGASYPSSFAALTFSVPIFQGGKRKANERTAMLQLDRNAFDIANLKNAINSQYAVALAGYQSSLENYLALKENVSLAKEVYDVIQLQYRSGIKTYLEVVTSETDLRTAQINYFNALNLVLANKVDVQRALGQIVY
ncbi:MAG: TolC family protein [Chitinophagaceae bacterium]